MEFRIDEIHDRVRPADDEERDRARADIHALARPRLTGSDGARRTEVELKRRIEDLGYRIQTLPFAFSTWPGSFGVPAAGAAYLAGTLAAATLLLLGRGSIAIATLLGLALLLAVAGRFARRAVLRLPFGRIEAENWLVHRPDVRPRFLIVAHRDSKSQPVSTFLRVGAVALAILAWAALLALATAAAAQPAWRSAALTLATLALALAAGVTLLLCRARNRSPGALDNATGLAALLGIARREREHDDVAFLITDGEELGLAGAWAIAPKLPPTIEAINLDGLDDHGNFYIVERFGRPRRGLAPRLAAALLHAAAALDLPAVRRDLPIGVLVDHIPFVLAGRPALTVMRGSFASFRRVHRPEDDVDRVDGGGAADAIALVSGALTLLRLRSAA